MYVDIAAKVGITLNITAPTLGEDVTLEAGPGITVAAIKTYIDVSKVLWYCFHQISGLCLFS